MDLNSLYSEHQLLLVRAQRVAAGSRRQAFETDARRIAAHIATTQRQTGAGAAPAWELLATLPGTAVCSALTTKSFSPAGGLAISGRRFA